MIKTMKRIALMFQIRCLEIQLYGQDECLACVSDPLIYARIHFARVNTKKELYLARNKYNSLLPMKEQKSWRLA